MPLRDDQRLDSLLNARSVEQAMYIYPGYSHTDITFDTTMYHRVRSWYVANGLIPATGIQERNRAAPKSVALTQNYPNPFNPKTGIRFQVSGVSDVRLAVYDILGREVAILVNETKQPGTYEVNFDGSDLASSVYFYRLTAGAYVETRKMVLMR